MALSDYNNAWTIRGGEITFIAAVAAILADHWNVYSINNIIPGIIDVAYIYVAINSVAAARLVYRRKKGTPIPKQCPQCDTQLNSLPKYVCPNCGEINFEKRDS